MEVWCGFRFDEVRPIDDLARLPADLPALLIGGGEDLRMPPASVQAMADRIPSKPGLKSVWIRPGSYHGQVWNDDPAGYREHLAAFMKLVVRP
jgi:pimeloyl-ACP methyl ester carboxylesterase